MGHWCKIFTILTLIHFPLFIIAQVMVIDEPRHKTVLKNNFVRVMDVRIGPGDTTLFHVHRTPSAFIVLSNTLVGSQLYNEKPNEAKTKIGTAWYNEFDKPLIHKVWNVDHTIFHVMDIEILTHPGDMMPKEILASNLSLITDERKVRIYKFQLKKSDNIKLKNIDSPILIFPTQGTVSINSKKRIDLGRFQYIEKDKTVTIKNMDNEEVTGIVFQIK